MSIHTFEYDAEYLGYLCNILDVHSIHLNIMGNIWDIFTVLLYQIRMLGRLSKYDIYISNNISDIADISLI
jgi:hypothetical protein